MRQVIAVFLLFSVLMSSTGFMLSKHFCGEELAHISLNETKTCCDSEKDMPSDCCHDEFDQLVLDDSQLNYQTLQLQPMTWVTLSVLTQFLSFSPQAAIIAFPWTAFHSPPIPDTPVYLRVQSFLL